MMKPYYEDSHVKIYHGDNKTILPELSPVDLVLTDPPYGINLQNGMGSGGYGIGGKRFPRRYDGDWDRPDSKPKQFDEIWCKCKHAVIWGGNYFSDILPQSNKWLVWNKETTMPTYSDCELAWTNMSGNSVKMFTYCGNGMLAKEKGRCHPTQKPVALIKWCISFYPEAETILDPFAGSGTTGRAAKDLNKKAILIEIEEKYCEIAAQRMCQEVLEL